MGQGVKSGDMIEQVKNKIQGSKEPETLSVRLKFSVFL